MANPLVLRRSIARFSERGLETVEDAVAVERALEIRTGGQTLTVTLRTPGHDAELALGFLAGEGLLTHRADVTELRSTFAECSDEPDRIDLTLAPGVVVDWTRFERHFAGTAACGLCGRAHLDSLRTGIRAMPVTTRIDAGSLASLPERLRDQQAAFTATGGLHAAAWCDARLEVQVLREDVGRHNAVDKVAGWLLERDRHPVDEGVLWVSGRAGAEIVLKAARARIPVLAAVGAPSSLAIDLAEAASMTLLGFVREGRMNVYAGGERLT